VRRVSGQGPPVQGLGTVGVAMGVEAEQTVAAQYRHVRRISLQRAREERLRFRHVSVGILFEGMHVTIDVSKEMYAL
jgi:hypothetical protein